MTHRIVRSAVLALAFAASASFAQVSVGEPWARATVPQQQVTGAFMRLTSIEPLRLVEVRSAVAGNVEIHEMKMEAGVMKMRAVPSLELPPGHPVELKPGGYHLMLFDLKKQIKAGDAVPLTLVLEAKDGKRRNVEITAKARAAGAP